MKYNVCFLLLLSILITPSLTKAADLSEEFRIGVIIPLSGDNATLGKFLKEGVDLAWKNLPEKLQSRIKLIFEDNQFQAAKAVSSYQKLHAVNKIHAVVVMGSGDAHALAPLVEMDKVLLFTIGASDMSISKERTFAFISWVNPAKEAEAAVSEMKRRNYKRLALIFGEQQGMRAFRDALDIAMKKEGLEKIIVLDETLLPDAMDFNTYLAKAQIKKPDAIFVCLWAAPLATFAKQVKQRGLSVDLVGAETFEDEAIVKASEGALVGHWFVNAADGNQEFFSSYVKTWGHKPGWGAAHAHDALLMLARGFERYGVNTAEIAKYLQNIKNFEGATGTFSSMGNNCFDFPAAIKMVTKEGFEKIAP